MKKQYCPDEEIFADYMEGRLSDEEREKIEKHISDCDLCIENLAAGKSLVRTLNGHNLESVPAQVTQSAIRLALELNTPLLDSLINKTKSVISAISDYLMPDFQNTQPLAAIRGHKEAVSDRCERNRLHFKGVDAEIEIEQPLFDSGRETKACVRVALTETFNPQGSANIRVTLKKENREIASHLLNDENYIIFEDISPASYQFSFAREGMEIGTYPFIISGSSYEKR